MRDATSLAARANAAGPAASALWALAAIAVADGVFDRGPRFAQKLGLVQGEVFEHLAKHRR
jgi:hypothetical protein